MLKYTHSLTLVMKNYSLEIFKYYEIGNPDNTEIEFEVGVSPDKGIVKRKTNENADFELFTDFVDISNIGIKCIENTKGETCYVTICTAMGQQRLFIMKNKVQAHSFIAAIDGCYRLLVDSHFYLVDEVCPKYVKEIVDAKIYGPITRIFAEHMLTNSPSGSCIVRANPETFDEFFITTKLADQRRYANFRINRTTEVDAVPENEWNSGNENFPYDYNAGPFGVGFFGRDDAPRFGTVSDFLRYYRHQGRIITGLPFDANQMITPMIKEDTSQKIFRFTKCMEFPRNTFLNVRRSHLEAKKKTQTWMNHNGVKSFQPTKTEHNILDESDLMEMDHISTGRFTEVIKCKLKPSEEMVVLKRLTHYDVNDRCGNFVKQQFFEAARMIKSCNHPCIITQYGITMTGWQVLEYGEYGGVDKYLRDEYQKRRDKTEKEGKDKIDKNGVKNGHSKPASEVGSGRYNGSISIKSHPHFKKIVTDAGKPTIDNTVCFECECVLKVSCLVVKTQKNTKFTKICDFQRREFRAVIHVTFWSLFGPKLDQFGTFSRKKTKFPLLSTHFHVHRKRLRRPRLGTLDARSLPTTRPGNEPPGGTRLRPRKHLRKKHASNARAQRPPGNKTRGSWSSRLLERGWIRGLAPSAQRHSSDPPTPRFTSRFTTRRFTHSRITAPEPKSISA